MRKFNYQIPIKGIMLILFEMGFGLNINLVGSISVSEIFVFLYTIYFLFKDPLLAEHSFQRIIMLYSGLFLAQCLSETIVSTSINNSLKGISITVISFCHLYFLIRMFKRSRYLVLWAYIGMLLKPFVMGTSYQGDTMMALNGQDNVYLKFVIAPLFINILMFYSYFNDNRKTSFLLIISGIIFMLLGARSWGALAFISGVLSYFIISGKLSDYRRILTYGAISCLIVYGAYVLYVNSVLSGKIATGNSGQIYRTENPYNPLNLLRVGRTEAFIGAIAFSDAPLWGHGAWKKDSECGYKYTSMKSSYQHLGAGAYADEIDLIPCHSVIIGFGCYNGIFAFIIGGILIIWFMKMGVIDVFETKVYVILLTYFLISFIWHSTFSPQSHFRLTLPLYMAFIYVNYQVYKNNTIWSSRQEIEAERRDDFVKAYQRKHKNQLLKDDD